MALTVMQGMTTKILRLIHRHSRSKTTSKTVKVRLFLSAVICSWHWERWISPYLHSEEKHISSCASGNVLCECWESKGSPRSCARRRMILSKPSTSFCLYAVYYVSKYAPSLKASSIPDCLVPVRWVFWVDRDPTQTTWRYRTTWDTSMVFF